MSAVRYLASVSYSEKLIEVKTVHIYLISAQRIAEIFEYLFRRGRRVVLGKGLHNRVTAVNL